MSRTLALRSAFAFVTGAASVLVFHQGVLELLYLAGVIPFVPYSMKPTAPLGVPAVVSAAFWGGVWGIIMIAALGRRLAGARYWTAALVFGAVLPTLVALVVVLPLKGQPMGGGWDPAHIGIGLLVNGAWGLGTALMLQGLVRLLPVAGARVGSGDPS